MNNHDHILYFSPLFWFAVFQLYSVAKLILNIIRKQHSGLNFLPVFYFLIAFLYFGLLYDFLTFLMALLYLILVLVFNLGLNTINYHLTEKYAIDPNQNQNG